MGCKLRELFESVSFAPPRWILRSKQSRSETFALWLSCLPPPYLRGEFAAAAFFQTFRRFGNCRNVEVSTEFVFPWTWNLEHWTADRRWTAGTGGLLTSLSANRLSGNQIGQRSYSIGSIIRKESQQIKTRPQLLAASANQFHSEWFFSWISAYGTSLTPQPKTSVPPFWAKSGPNPVFGWLTGR